MMIIAFIYFMFTCIYCEAVIKDAVVLRETSKKTIAYTEILMTSNEHLEIQISIRNLENTLARVQENAQGIYDAFYVINLLCYFNLVFFLTQIIQFIFLRKLERKFPFPTISLFTDLILFVVSLYTGYWI